MYTEYCPIKTSWEEVDRWYDSIVGEEGHYYHTHVVLPNVLKLLNLKEDSSLLDLACGQGVLERKVAKEMRYLGVDLSPSLIASSKKMRASPKHEFVVGDITKPLSVKGTFSHATILLALQNVENPASALKNAAEYLQKDGTLIVVLNHPCFRIPRQSAWGVDEAQNLQFRRVNRYLSPLKIPIQMHPGKGQKSESTWSFHHSLSDFSRFLQEAGFSIALIEEWTSDKKSTGKNAKRENLARAEFPLFLAIKAIKR